MNKHHFYPEHLKSLKYFALAMFVILPFLSFMIGVAYEDMKFFDMADPRTKVFMTQEECEQTTNASCTFTTCDYVPPGKTVEEVCGTGFTKGWIPLDTQLPPTDTMPIGSYESVCQNASGAWIGQYNECEGMSQTQCANLDGSFNECASACRHNPDPQAACIQVCIAVCTFN